MATAEIGEHILTTVREAARVHKGLRRGVLELSRDILVLLSALKPAVLLDYVSVPPDGVLSMLQTIQTHQSFPIPGVNLAVATLNDCTLILNVAMTLKRLTTKSHASRFIVFNTVSNSDSTWATLEQQQSLLDKFGALTDLCQQNDAPMHDSIIVLDSLNLPLQPTLQGWLLGYPVVYYVTEQGIDSVSRYLSETSLILITLHAVFPKFQKLSHGVRPGQDLSQISACTLPSHLMPKGSEDQILKGWKHDVLATAQPDGLQLWDSLKVKLMPVNANIVL